MTQSRTPDDKNKPLDTLREGAEEKIEQLVDTELQLERLAEEEFSLLSAYVAEDVKGVRRFWTELREEWESMERRTGHWLLKAADAANVDISHWKSRISHPETVWVAGDPAPPESLVCLCCGAVKDKVERATKQGGAEASESLITACDSCGGVYFQLADQPE